jgi:uncharacterized protein DUF4129
VGADGGFARWWTEGVADLADHVPGGVAGIAGIVLLLAGAAVAVQYWWPHRRWPRWRRARPNITEPEPLPAETEPEPDPEDELPERPPAELLSLADRYAAAGRYAEAVRERLRAMVRLLVDRGIIEHRPGWTVTELAAAAGTAEPTLAAPLDEAAAIFSAIWYGQRPATPAHDARMRQLAAQVDGVRQEVLR